VLEFRCGWLVVVSVLQASACNTDTTPTQPRKENNWKTEEAFARAAVTLETERIKGSNPDVYDDDDDDYD